MIGSCKPPAKSLGASRQAFAAIWALGVLLCGCARDGAQSGAPASAAPASSSADAAYVRPPEATAARRQDGGVMLAGQADPNVRVRLSSPDGMAYGVTADGQGRWVVVPPASNDLRLFGLSEVLGSRAVQGAGYLAVLPAPGPVGVLLRAGGDSEVLTAPGNAPRITVVDYDAGGGAVVSGLGRPGLTVRLTLDGGAAGEARPDGRGRFSIPLAGQLSPGAHQAVVESNAGAGRADFTIDQPASITSGLPYRGARLANAWRIDWLTPGGSGQTTLVVDPAGEPRRP